MKCKHKWHPVQVVRGTVVTPHRTLKIDERRTILWVCERCSKIKETEENEFES